MEELEKDDGKEMKINPNDVSASKFKEFACGFMFSTGKQLTVLSEINTKLDAVVAANAANLTRIETLENDVSELKNDLQGVVDLKDREINDLHVEVVKSNEKIAELERKINSISTKQEKDLVDLNQKCGKLREETLTLERYTRSFNFRLFNLPGDDAGEKSKDVIRKVNALITEVTGTHTKVEFGHRTGPRRADGPRAVICRVASRSEKMEMMTRRGEFFTKGHPIYDDLPFVDLEEKKKHAAAMKVRYDQHQKTQFIRGKWYLNGVVYNG